MTRWKTDDLADRRSGKSEQDGVNVVGPKADGPAPDTAPGPPLPGPPRFRLGEYNRVQEFVREGTERDVHAGFVDLSAGRVDFSGKRWITWITYAPTNRSAPHIFSP